MVSGEKVVFKRSKGPRSDGERLSAVEKMADRKKIKINRIFRTHRRLGERN